MTTFSNGSLVWVDLGHSYGRWPAEVVDPGEAKKEDSSSKYMYVSKTFVPKRDTEPGLKKNKAVDKGEGAASTSEELPLKDISSRNNANKEPAVVETMVSLRFFDDLKEWETFNFRKFGSLYIQYTYIGMTTKKCVVENKSYHRRSRMVNMRFFKRIFFAGIQYYFY